MGGGAGVAQCVLGGAGVRSGVEGGEARVLLMVGGTRRDGRRAAAPCGMAAGQAGGGAGPTSAAAAAAASPPGTRRRSPPTSGECGARCLPGRAAVGTAPSSRHAKREQTSKMRARVPIGCGTGRCVCPGCHGGRAAVASGGGPTGARPVALTIAPTAAVRRRRCCGRRPRALRVSVGGTGARQLRDVSHKRRGFPHTDSLDCALQRTPAVGSTPPGLQRPTGPAPPPLPGWRRGPPETR